MKPTIAWFSKNLTGVSSALNAAMDLGPISIDTRTLREGDTFWALKSQRDGHDFVAAAFERGAKAAVVNLEWRNSEAAAPFRDRLIGVPDSLSALTQAAELWRHAFPCPVLGITGTNGKTSTKDFILHLLAGHLKAIGTQGNFNNEIGVPLTLLSIPANADLAIIEMGASHPGDIAYLCGIARPTHGLVTSIGRAHLEGFGSPEAIAATKGELYHEIAETGIAFVPADDAQCVDQAAMCRNKIGYGFGSLPGRGFREVYSGNQLTFDGFGRAQFEFAGLTMKLSVPGRPAALSALAALAVASHFGIDPQQCQMAVGSWQATRGRTEIQFVGNILLMDDSYNANPSSMRAALETLSHLTGKRHIAILGDMNELGAYADAEHRSLGQELSEFGITAGIFVGAYAGLAAEAAVRSKVMAVSFKGFEEFSAELPHLIQDGDAVLVKGSRSMKLERVVEMLKRIFA